MVILFFHLSFLFKIYKDIETKSKLQNFFDYSVRQIELSIREIGYGDATINKKMKDYINILYSIIDKVDKWENKSSKEKVEIIKLFIDDSSNYEKSVVYFDKYSTFLRNNTFNNLTKDIITF